MEYLNSYDFRTFDDFSWQYLNNGNRQDGMLERKRSNALERKASLARKKSRHGRKPTLAAPIETVIAEEPTSPGPAEEKPALVTVDEDDEKYANLSPAERKVIKDQVDVLDNQVTFKQLWRFSTKKDTIVIWVSIVCAIAGGSALPLMNVVFGRVAGVFQNYLLGNVPADEFQTDLNHFALYFVYLAVAEFITIYVATVGFIYTGDHITNTIRQEYLAALFRQNIAFFDSVGAGEVTTRITADCNLIQEAISEKVGLVVTGLSTFVTVFVVGFFFFWKLTLICSCVIFAIVLSMGGGSKFLAEWNKKSLELNSVGGTLAEEVLSTVRTAVAFGLQNKLGNKYEEQLAAAYKWGLKAKILLGVMVGSVFCYIYLTYGLAFWMGSRFLVDGETTLANILTIIMSIIIGSMTLGTVSINAQAFSSGIAAAHKIYSTIDRHSPIDPSSAEGGKLDQVIGSVRLEHIRHIYPSRPDVVVTDDLNLDVPAGKTTALVGASGSGKSTIIGLLQRFYLPVGGKIYLDGCDISELNVRWLRQQISLVQQEPVLFSTTVMENIAYGLVGSRFENLSLDEKEYRVLEAAKMANAHDFITQLPEGYRTHIGERGLLLSGGQKQRVAIARAIISDPKILLLDEATSALDTQSEKIVQAALDKASQGRTTIVVAHRLSTIKNAENIVVMESGRIIEQGSHQSLLALQGTYSRLVQAQNIGESADAEPPAYDNSWAANRYSTGYSSGYRDSIPADMSTLSGDIMHDLGSQTCLVTKQNSDPVPDIAIAASEMPKVESQYGLGTLVKFTSHFNKPDWPYVVAGLFFSVLSGLGNPIQGIFFSKAINALSQPLKDRDEIRSETDFWCMLYIALGFFTLFTIFLEHACFGYTAEKLIYRCRDFAFRTMLRQDVSFYDESDHEVGSLTSFLSTEANHLAGISGATVGTILSAVSTLAASMLISLVIGWKLALVCMAGIPVLVGCGFARFKALANIQQRSQKAYSKSASYACENMNAIRTVASLTREHDVHSIYRVQVESHGKASLMSNLRSSILYAASESAVFLCIALGFWYGGGLIKTHEYTLFEFFVCFSEVIFGAQAAGTVFSFAPDMGKAKGAAERLKELADRQITINTTSLQGRRLDGTQGTIEFKNVHFRYPTRPGVHVLRGLNLKIKPGQFVALVGRSGCGKSTIIQLIERFYDPTEGKVAIDHQDISKLRVDDYRSCIGLVSQEPALYQGTVRDNILLGAEGAEISEAQLFQACKEANIYDFIMSLPAGFDTEVGNKAVMLSGGQKQRIAIARALIRNPRVLLLDEATSALDSQSEQVVQAALDVAAKGRTTIAVVHRLSSIRNADVIFVLDQGVVVEAGNHNDLMSLGGQYKQMVLAQSLEENMQSR